MFYAVDLLAFYGYIHSYLQETMERIKTRMRTYLGPQIPDKFFLLQSGSVIPSIVSHNHDQESSALIYDTATKHIVRNSLCNEEKLQRIPYLTLIHKCGDEQHDFSEWISEVRAVRQPSLLSLVRLAGFIHNVFLNEHHGTEIHVITRSGEEEVYTFRHTTELVLRTLQQPSVEGSSLETEHHSRT
jgi:hypothetical protein